MSHKCHSILRNEKGLVVAEVAGLSAQLATGHVIPEHLHPEDQLLFASQGVMTVTTVEGLWVVPPLRAVWIPANTFHTVSMSGHVSMRTLYLLPGVVRGLPRKCFVINVSPLLRELILHACAFGKLKKGTPVQRRIIEIIVDQLKACESIPLQLSILRRAGNEGGPRARGRPC